MYNSRMIRLSTWVFCALSLTFTVAKTAAQSSSSQKPVISQADAGAVVRGVNLAESGHCKEALPLLRKAVRQVADKDVKRRAGLDGVHCAMTGPNPYDAMDFLQVLVRDFPRDPEVLYVATHCYSDLSLRTSQDLMREAPFSFQVHQLNAEALETQGRWPEAAAEYQKILAINPMLAGIHARIGRVLLSGQQPTPEQVAQEKL